MEMLKTTIDLGNGFTKFLKGVSVSRFASKVELGSKPAVGIKPKEIHYVKYQGENYVIGQGKNFIGSDRYFSKQYEMCLLTAIALSNKVATCNIINTKVVIGLPKSKIETVAAKLKNHLTSIKQRNIVVDEVTYTISIADVSITIEGAYPILIQDISDCLVIDRGAGTTNVNHFRGLQLINSKTYETSELNMISDITAKLQDAYGIPLKAESIEPHIYKDKTVLALKERDIKTYAEPIIMEHINGVLSDIQKDFDFSTLEKIYLVGGSAKETKKYFQKKFSVIETVENNQYTNLLFYKKVAERI